MCFVDYFNKLEWWWWWFWHFVPGSAARPIFAALTRKVCAPSVNCMVIVCQCMVVVVSRKQLWPRCRSSEIMSSSFVFKIYSNYWPCRKIPTTDTSGIFNELKIFRCTQQCTEYETKPMQLLCFPSSQGDRVYAGESSPRKFNHERLLGPRGVQHRLLPQISTI